MTSTLTATERPAASPGGHPDTQEGPLGAQRRSGVGSQPMPAGQNGTKRSRPKDTDELVASIMRLLTAIEQRGYQAAEPDPARPWLAADPSVLRDLDAVADRASQLTVRLARFFHGCGWSYADIGAELRPPLDPNSAWYRFDPKAGRTGRRQDPVVTARRRAARKAGA